MMTKKLSSKQDERWPSYTSLVKSQTACNPSLMNLYKFLSDPNSKDCSVRVVILDFTTLDNTPIRHDIQVIQVPHFLADFDIPQSEKKSPCEDGEKEVPMNNGRNLKIVIVEDLTKEAIEVLGQFFNIDPLFLASHVHSPWISDNQTPDLATLPSIMKPNKYINAYYHRVIVFENSKPPANRMSRDSHVSRKVMVLPWFNRKYLGLAQHCVSVLQVSGSNYDVGLILVDRPIGFHYYYRPRGESNLIKTYIPTSLFSGGYESFIDPPDFNSNPKSHMYPSRHGMMDDLIHYFTHNTHHWTPIRTGRESNENSTPISLLAHYPLSIVAAEWITYVTVMQRSIKRYEYAQDDEFAISRPNSLGYITPLMKLNTDLRALQSWRRRSMSSQHKLRAVLAHLRAWEKSEQRSLEMSDYDDNQAESPVLALLADYSELAARVNESGKQLENMVPIVMSLVHVVDSRRSFAETSNITRLTVLALVFVPLTFIATLFSMEARYIPGATCFWVYLVVAIPITTVVVLLAHPSIRAIGLRFWSNKRMRVNEEEK